MDEVPLIEKVQKNDINTTIIAIKKQLKELNALLGLIDIQSDKQDLSPYVRKDEVIDEVKRFDLSPVTSNAVANSLSYSTEEKCTGGYWIDGKKIYRKCYTVQVPYTGWVILFNLQDIGINMDTMVSVSGVCVTIGGLTRPILANDQGDTSQFSFYIQNKNAFYVSMRNNDWVGSYTLVFEYTKTTD